jgi:hypothetical protein
MYWIIKKIKFKRIQGWVIDNKVYGKNTRLMIIQEV